MTTTDEMVREARTVVEALAPDEVACALRHRTTIVDVREADERADRGSIPGSLHVPRGVLELCADPTDPCHHPRLDPDRSVIVYCDDGLRSALAGATLVRLGYRHVAHIRGGLVAWISAGHELVGARPLPY